MFERFSCCLNISSSLQAFLVSLRRILSRCNFCYAASFHSCLHRFLSPLVILYIILSVSSSAPCTSLEVFRASFWTMCWPTPLRPARPFLTQLCVLLLGRASAAIGSKVDAPPGSQKTASTLSLLLFAPCDLVRYTGVPYFQLLLSFFLLINFILCVLSVVLRCLGYSKTYGN